MEDYKEMYNVLFNAITDCISILQEAQKKTEEMYISSKPAIKLAPANTKKKNDTK